MKTKSKLVHHRLGTALLRMVPVGAAKSHATRKTIQHFAESLGLVYFGYVNQHSDEHELVRGFTLSMGHRDNHYCVGSLNGYDIILVERTDVITYPGQPLQRFKWLILQIDLHARDFPQVFFNSVHHPETYYANFFIKHGRFQKIDDGLWLGHDPLFLKTFSVFGEPSHGREIAKLFSLDTTATMAHHFRGLEFELGDDKLYVYACNQQATQALLERMVKNGLWLASQLDAAKALE